MSETRVKCATCDINELLPHQSIQSEMLTVPLWTLSGDEKQISRRFDAKNFQIAMNFIQRAGEIAEQMGHHPDIHLTRYRTVEIVLYTHKLGGLTEVDFKIARALDEIPIEYSAMWLKTKASGTASHKENEPVARQRSRSKEHHNPEDSASEFSSTEVHRDRDAPPVLHPHEFVVHAGHETPKGQSDAPHHEIRSIKSRSGSFETETQHAQEQTMSGKVSHKQFGKEYPQSSVGPAVVSKNPNIWPRLVADLKILIHHGYDKTESEYYMPMFESHQIYNDASGDVYRFYQHLLKRLTPEWRSTEPPAVVSACVDFVEGYEELCGIVA